MKLIFWFLFYRVLGENVIDNKVRTRGTISTLEISSTQYNIPTLELNLVYEPDEFIFGTEEKGSFVVSPQGEDVKAFGYIEDGRFFGQFSYDGRTYLVDPLPPGQEGGKLVPRDQLKGLIGIKEPLPSLTARIISQVWVSRTKWCRLQWFIMAELMVRGPGTALWGTSAR